jgi:hypothetical protein
MRGSFVMPLQARLPRLRGRTLHMTTATKAQGHVVSVVSPATNNALSFVLPDLNVLIRCWVPRLPCSMRFCGRATAIVSMARLACDLQCGCVVSNK